jgi:hypothetical protein
MRDDKEVRPLIRSDVASKGGLPFLDVQDGLYGPDDSVEGFYRFRADG